MRLITYLLASLCRKIALFFGQLGIKFEDTYNDITEARRA